MKKLKNARALFTQAGDEETFEINTGSVSDFFKEGFDEIKSGETKPKHLIFSVLCLLAMLCLTWGDIILMHLEK